MQRTFEHNQTLLFEVGIKPAAFHSQQRTEGKYLLKKGYPYITVARENNICYLFFRNKQDKKEFMKKHRLKTDQVFSLDHKMIGDALGFPPLAIEAFPIENRNDRAFIRYHGFVFACHKKDVDECLNYMKKNYPIPRGYAWGIEIGHFEEGVLIEKRILA